jgi:hypothetical protein
MRLRLVILFALLLDWKLKHILPEWHAHAEALAMCKWNKDFDSIAEALGEDFKTCTWLLAGPYGRPNELPTMLVAATQWLIDSAKLLTNVS